MSEGDVREVASEPSLAAGDVRGGAHRNVFGCGPGISFASFERARPRDRDGSGHLGQQADCPQRGLARECAGESVIDSLRFEVAFGLDRLEQDRNGVPQVRSAR